MKSFTLTVARHDSSATFQLKRLGLHEPMSPGLIDRPQGTQDYLFMLFHSEVQAKSRDGEAVWPASSLIIWTPQDSHYYGNSRISWDHSWFHCSGQEIGAILRAHRILTSRRIPIDDPGLMKHFLLEAVAELSGWRQPNGKILRNLFENFICALARHVFQKNERLPPTPLLAVRAYVEQHFTEPLRLDQLAKQAGWSVPHLCAEFRRYFGTPIIQYAMQLKMSQATYLLRDHNRRIGEVGLALGYPDLYAFSKMFKHYMGVSPKKFRDLNVRATSPPHQRGGPY